MGKAAAKRTRVGGKAPARMTLLDTAEQLFARNGISGVSLREIAAAAGQRNNSAAHYYFRDKRGLVEALIADRIAKVEEERARLVAELKDIADLDIAALLRLLWQPMLDVCEGRGGNWLVQFHLSYHLSFDGERDARHPMVADPVHHPASSALLAALKARTPHLSDEHFRYRVGLLFMMFWAAVARFEQAADVTGARFSLDEPIKLAVAGLEAAA